MSSISVRTFLAWKIGDDAEDCQDSIFPFESVNWESGSYAVADGATTSFLSRSWARILTQRFGADPERAYRDWLGWLRDAQAEWRAEVEKAAQAENASFLVINGLLAKRPAAATFAGLTLAQPTVDGWPWHAIVLGDSCLFRLTESGALRGWNIQSSGEFSNVVETAESWPKPDQHSPKMVGSAPYGGEPVIGSREIMLLVTDALAKWLLRRHESGHPVWGTIISLKSNNDFQAFVAQARADLTIPLENDDIALVVLAFGDTSTDISSQTYTPVLPIEVAPAPSTTRITTVHGGQESLFSTLPTASPRTITPRSISKQIVLSIRQSVVLYLLLVFAFAAFALAMRSSHKWRLKSQRLTRDNAVLRRQLETDKESRRLRNPAIPVASSSAGSAERSLSPGQLQKDSLENKILPSHLDRDAQGPLDAPTTKTEDNHPRDVDPLPRALQDVTMRLTLPPPIEASPWPEPRPQ